MEAVDPKVRFSGRAEDYSACRPPYPEDIIALAVEEFGLKREWIVADVGAGTGQSSERFLEFGCRIIGVEPNAEMRAGAAKAHASNQRFRIVEGSAEETELPSKCADLYVSGQAFHWFDPPEARREAMRILKPPRHAMVMWNDRRAEGSAFTAAYSAFIESRFSGVRSKRRAELGPADFDAFFGKSRWKEKTFRHCLDYAIERLIGLFFSQSYVPGRDDPESMLLESELGSLFRTHEKGGTVRMEYETKVYFGDLG